MAEDPKESQSMAALKVLQLTAVSTAFEILQKKSLTMVKERSRIAGSTVKLSKRAISHRLKHVELALLLGWKLSQVVLRNVSQ